MKNVLTIAVGLIPVIGPFLAVAFPIAWTLLSDPDSAFEELKNLVPGIDLADRIIRERILKSAEECKKYLPQGWEQLALPAQSTKQAQSQSLEDADTSTPAEVQDIGMSLIFILAGEILAKKHLVPPPEYEPTDPPTEKDGPGEILLINPPTDRPSEENELRSF